MDIDLVDKLCPYTGKYKSAGMDDKNHLPVPKPFVDTLNRRKKAFGLDDRVIYYSPETPDSSLFVLRDYILGKEECANFYPAELDSQNRITIKVEIVDKMSKKRDFVYVGLGDHIKVYAKEEFEDIQTIK